VVGEVYDVTAGKEYYGPGSGYNIFAGRKTELPKLRVVFSI
jgi:hypothetical protein